MKECDTMLFDTHAHLDDRAFDVDRETLLTQLPIEGVGLVMNPGCSRASSLAAIELANRFDYVYAAVGSHPDAADEVNEEVLQQYRALCLENPKVKAMARSAAVTRAIGKPLKAFGVSVSAMRMRIAEKRTMTNRNPRLVPMALAMDMPKSRAWEAFSSTTPRTAQLVVMRGR